MADEAIEASSQPDRPEWLVSNFDSVEAQAQAYNEARTAMGRAQTEVRDWQAHASALEERLAELEQMQAEPATPDPQLPFNPLLAEYQQAQEMGDIERQLQIQTFMMSQIADNRVQQALAQAQQGQQQQGPDPAQTEMFAMWADNAARERYDNRYGQGEYDLVRRDAAEFLAANPDLLSEDATPTTAAERLVWAAEYVNGQKLLAANDTERNQLLEARQRRMMSQTLTGSGATPPTQSDPAAAWDAIKNAPAGSYSELMGR